LSKCEAARTIKARYVLKAAFDYLVGEKLMNFASAASKYPEFAREFPRFISAVLLQIDEARIRDHLGEMVRGTVRSVERHAGC
jgi:hypothetical protein